MRVRILWPWGDLDPMGGGGPDPDDEPDTDEPED